MRKFLTYSIPVAAGFVMGFIASRLQAGAIESWYPYLNKPAATPPNWMFPVAWGLIYLMSGISAGLIWNKGGIQRRGLLSLWGFQLLFNFTWSIMFFVLQSPLLGLVNILLLDILVALYAAAAWPVNRAASVLFWPYLAWLCLATYLNGYILLYN